MRKLRAPASAGLAGLLFGLLSLAACGGSPAPAAAGGGCAGGSQPHHAYLVVEHLSGRTVDRCVGFSGPTIAGDQLMKESGVVFSTQHFSFGDAVCSMDREPAAFDTCLPQNAPYWALWTEKAGAGWQQAQVGYAAVQLADGDALGWRYTPATDQNPSPPPPPVRAG